MQIEQHVRELLRQHAYVAIPGVGSFCSNYTPATIDEKEKFITPPAYDFSFDAARTFDDGAISNYLNVKYGLSIQKAHQCIEEWVSTIEARLAVGESIPFDGVGTLRRPHDDIEFTPCPPALRATPSYGLLPVPLPSRDVEKKRKEKRKTQRNAALILLSSLLLAGGGYAAYNYLDWPYIASVMPWNRADSKPIAAAAPSANTNDVAETTPPRNIDTSVPPPKAQLSTNLVDSSLQQHNALQPVENTTLYYIVVGSFRNEQNAEKQINDLRNMGFLDPKMRRKNEFYQVYVAYYTNLTYAQAKRDELIRKYGENFCFLDKVSK